MELYHEVVVEAPRHESVDRGEVRILYGLYDLECGAVDLFKLDQAPPSLPVVGLVVHQTAIREGSTRISY